MLPLNAAAEKLHIHTIYIYTTGSLEAASIAMKESDEKAYIAQTALLHIITPPIDHESQLRVIQRVEHIDESNNTEMWCLVSYSIPAVGTDAITTSSNSIDHNADTQHEDNTSNSTTRKHVTEWRTQTEIDRLIADAVSQRRLPEAYTLPASPVPLQQQAAQALQSAVTAHTAELTALKEEQSSMSKTFQTYRNKAYTALKDLTSKEAAAQALLTEAQEQLAIEKEKRIACESDKRYCEREFNQKLNEQAVQCDALQEQLDTTQTKLSTVMEQMQADITTQVQAGLEVMMTELNTVKASNQELIATLNDTIKQLEDRVKVLQDENERVKKESQTKSALAKQVIAAKDAELKRRASVL
jgi:DNA repair exonuclease SbcCD ATPase subunit